MMPERTEENQVRGLDTAEFYWCVFHSQLEQGYTAIRRMKNGQYHVYEGCYSDSSGSVNPCGVTSYGIVRDNETGKPRRFNSPIDVQQRYVSAVFGGGGLMEFSYYLNGLQLRELESVGTYLRSDGMTYTMMADGRADIDTETPLSEIEPDGDWMSTLSSHDREIVAVVVAWNKREVK